LYTIFILAFDATSSTFSNESHLFIPIVGGGGGGGGGEERSVLILRASKQRCLFRESAQIHDSHDSFLRVVPNYMISKTNTDNI
jgi:hypothetical protein